MRIVSNLKHIDYAYSGCVLTISTMRIVSFHVSYIFTKYSDFGNYENTKFFRNEQSEFASDFGGM